MSHKKFISKWNTLSEMEDRLSLLKKTIRNIYSNKDLVTFLEQLLHLVINPNEKKVVLLFAKKIVNQYPRKLQSDFYEAVKEEVEANRNTFEREQKEYDPQRWIEHELDFIEDTAQLNVTEVGFKKIYTSPVSLEKELLTREELMDLLQISKSTLDRRRWDGMPHIKKGRKIYFKKSEVFNWLNKVT